MTDGDSRFDLAVGGKSWFFYPIERLGGINGHRDTSRGWMSRHDLRPGKILWEVQEAYQPGVVREKLRAARWNTPRSGKVAQRLTDRPVKFGAICAPALASMLWNEYYDDDKAMILDLCDIMNAEFRELADAGCPLIQVEEPPHHRPRACGRLHRRRSGVPDRGVQSPARRRQRRDLGAHLLGQSRTSSASTGRCRATSGRCRICCDSNCDVITFECASQRRPGPAAFGKSRPTRRSASAWSTTATRWWSRPSTWPALIRKALEYIPGSGWSSATDCGFGREGLTRRIAYYKCVALVEGTNIVRRELGLPEARVRAADPKLWFAGR